MLEVFEDENVLIGYSLSQSLAQQSLQLFRHGEVGVSVYLWLSLQLY